MNWLIKVFIFEALPAIMLVFWMKQAYFKK